MLASSIPEAFANGEGGTGDLLLYLGKWVSHALGETGVERDSVMSGRLSKCCSAGEEMADNVSIKELMTSGDAGLMWGRFEERRLES